jgi:signal transduction histidine kinase
LGLSIAKSIVDIHGGKIWATSDLGKSTMFFIELPAAKA